MQRTDRLRAIFVLLLSLIGTAVLFLPFTHNVSPWEAVIRGGFFLLGAPFFLAVAILAWESRKLLANQFSVFELAAAYVLSTAAMISVLTFTVIVSWEDGWKTFREVVAIVSIGSCWTLAVANVGLLWRNLAKGVAREVAAEAFLLGGYLPNAAFCLVAFGWDGRLQIGAYLIALVSLGYFVAIILLSLQNPPGTSPKLVPDTF